MPQMAPLYWSISLLLVWVVLGSVCVLVWWMLSSSRYSFRYKN
uniref:ATP synthase F0 subunit 8 n=1 Tax=Macoma balthica TaxID=1903275 RepID=A0A0B4U649_MACBL|nr:ATP synthase F0 subunit 8 [Macoma balthica]